MITRRWFLIGSGAAIAAAAMPFATPVTAGAPYRTRHIVGLSASSAGNGAGNIALFARGQPLPLLHFGLGSGGFLEWRAAPDGHIIIRRQDVVKLAFDNLSPIGNASLGTIGLRVDDYVDDGPPIQLVEQHTFPQRGPADIFHIHTDNSLAARLERKAEAERRATMPIDWSEYDE